jgi:hypothetical protein
MKKKVVLNHEVITKQLGKDSVYNWLVIKGVENFNQGKLGKNMEHFLYTIGVIEYK